MEEEHSLTDKVETQITPIIIFGNNEYWLPYLLEPMKGLFQKYVFVALNSNDSSVEVVRDFIENERTRADIKFRIFHDIDNLDLIKNASITEASTDWYFMVNGFEVYSKRGLEDIADAYFSLKREYEFFGTSVCQVEAIEVQKNLEYGYRTIEPTYPVLFHRTISWVSGENTNKEKAEGRSDIKCFRFSALSQTKLTDDIDFKYSGRRQDIELLDQLPQLGAPLNGFQYHPKLKEIWKKYAKLHDKTL